MKKYTKILIGDKEYKLRFTINDLIELEDMTGKSLAQINGESLKEIRALFFVGLKPKAKTEKEAGELLTEAIEELGMDGLMETITKAMTNSLGEGKQEVQ